MDKLTYSIPEVARLLGISRMAAYNFAKAGQIPCIRIGRRCLVPVAALHQMLEQVGRASEVA